MLYNIDVIIKYFFWRFLLLSNNISKLLKFAGQQALKAVIEKVFPPDSPIEDFEKGKHYGFLKDNKQYSLYWGDLHGHSELSAEAAGSPDEYYQYARDNRKLDFVALTDHDFSMNSHKWEIIQQKAAEYYQSGRFVNFVAYEWTSHFGHKVVLFPNTEVPEKIMVRSRRKEDNPYALWKFLKEYKAITIPHHTFSYGVTTNWVYKSNELEPLVEIYSKHGSCECIGSKPVPFRIEKKEHSVAHALNTSHRLGFIGCSDTHYAKPGSKESIELLTHRLILKYKSGFTGVFAEELTREGIWEALKARRTFATTGIRLFADFRIGKHLMGEEFKASEIERISLWIEAPIEVELVEIIKNGKCLFSEKVDSKKVTMSWKDTSPDKGSNYYYPRITLKDSNRAWISPIWVHYE